jgi:hypothetical protein
MNQEVMAYLARLKPEIFEALKDELFVFARRERLGYTTHWYFLFAIQLKRYPHPTSLLKLL